MRILPALLLLVACHPRLPAAPATLPEPAKPVIFEGTVSRGVPGNPAGIPFPGALVEIAETGMRAVAGADGSYRMEALLPLKRVRRLTFYVFDKAEGERAPPLGILPYDLPAGVDGVIARDLMVDARGSIRGRLTAQGGDAPNTAGAMVFLDGIPGCDDIAGPDGTFLLYGVPRGTVDLRVLLPGFASAIDLPLALDVRAYEETVLGEDIILSRLEGAGVGAPVSGAIEVPAGVDPTALEVRITPDYYGLDGDIQDERLSVDAEGHFSGALLLVEPHTLTVTGPGIAPLRALRVVPGTTDLEFFAVAAPSAPIAAGDRDGDGVLDADDAFPDNPFSASDRDDDGLGDTRDWDNDNDCRGDLEEMCPGADGRTGDPDDPERGGVMTADLLASTSSDGVFSVDSESSVTFIDPSEPIVDGLARDFPKAVVLSGPISVQFERGVTQLSVLIPGFRGSREQPPRLAIIDGGCDASSCLDAIRAVPLGGTELNCEPTARGRLRCSTTVSIDQAQGTTETFMVWQPWPFVPQDRCGDGQVQAGEACDDGNAIDEDACTNTCRLARCGDGILFDEQEECDDGNSAANDECTDSCAAARCGDGILFAGQEECDDGNSAANDECTESCAAARCGDGILFAGQEECDDGNSAANDECTDSCGLARCGDGIRRTDLREYGTEYEFCDGDDGANGEVCLDDCRIQDDHGNVHTAACEMTVDGDAVNGILEQPGDQDWFRFDTLLGSTVRCTVEGPTDETCTLFSLGQDMSLALIAEANGAGMRTCVVSVLAIPGSTYFCRVTRSAITLDDPVNYEVRIVASP
jgi:cysteine-rich repeat protein